MPPVDATIAACAAAAETASELEAVPPSAMPNTWQANLAGGRMARANRQHAAKFPG